MVHFAGRFIACAKFPANAEVVANVLLDTGALCANYISEFKFNELRENNYIFPDDIIWRRTYIGLADNATKFKVLDEVTPVVRSYLSLFHC